MPGRCPSCNQTYTDETLSFCPNDGTPLIKEAPSSYDPQATMISQPPPNYPPQQGYYPPPQGGQAPPPQGGQTPPPGWQQPPPYDQQTPYGQPQPPYGQQQQYTPQYGAPGPGKSKLPLIIAIAAVLLIGGGIGAYFLMRDNSSTSSKVDSNNNNSTNSTRNTSVTTTLPTATPRTTPSTTTTTTTDSSLSEDEKYRIFFAAAKTGDPALQTEIAKKIGIIDSSGAPTDYYQVFIKGAAAWATRDVAWVQQHNTPETAKAWVDAHR
jgi:hypothetical protein